MKKNLMLLSAGILFGILASIILLQHETVIFKPILKKPSFIYLNNTIEEVLKDIKNIDNDLQVDNNVELNKHLHHIKDGLFKLQFFYIPMTNVRQLIYNAERLFLRNKTKKSKNRLKKANNILVKMGKSDNSMLKKSVNELYLMIDRLILEIEESPGTAQKKFKPTVFLKKIIVFNHLRNLKRSDHDKEDICFI